MENSSNISFITSGAIAATTLILVYRFFHSNDHLAKKAGLSLPPGPRRLPFLDNLLNFPKNKWYEVFSDWKYKYGDIVYVNILGHSMIILNSLEAIDELMGKRANNFSNRPSTVMATELLGMQWTLVMAQPGHSVNEMRKILRKEIGPQAVVQYDYIVQEEAENLVQALSGFSGNILDRIEDTVAAIIIRVGYGSQVFKEHGEELSKLNKDLAVCITGIFKTIWIVDIFPFLAYLPSWFPGTSFHRVAKEGRYYLNLGRNLAFDMAKSVSENGAAEISIASKYLHSPDVDLDMVRDAIAQLYGAAVDTTATVITNYLYNMVVYPDIQRRVQQELDMVIGHGRVPTIEECSKLVYHNAVWKESLRLRVPIPLGAPHTSAEADVWKGYYIPKGSMVHCNIGFILRDPRLWGEDATSFRPDRFLNSQDLPDPSSAVFGFGNRACPGRILAERISILFTAALLSSYDIVPVPGEEIPLDMEWDDSTVRRPSKFRCHLKPRVKQ